MVKRKDSRLLFHGHDFRYGNSTDFRCHQGLIREAVRSFTCESATYACGDHPTFMADDVESVRSSGRRVQGDSEDIGVSGDGVADPASVVVGQGCTVGGQHEPVVGVLAEVPDWRPA